MARINVLKTYKNFIGGKFPRTESGRYFQIKNGNNELLANMCLSSRKDFRNAVVVARKVQKSWQNATALNRGQVLYRVAEMLESRKSQFIEELMMTGLSKPLFKSLVWEVQEGVEVVEVQTDSALKAYLQTDQKRGEEEGAEVSELLQWVVAQLDSP